MYRNERELIMNSDLEQMFSYAQQIASCFVRAMSKGRFSSDDKATVKYLCRLIIEKMDELP